MKILLLGYGKEGQASKEYFQAKNNKVDVLDNFTPEELADKDFSEYDLILRSPSVPPRPDFSSATRYFFDNCKAPIIGVTGTKGKGTTCSLISAILKALGKTVYLVGNIGNPAIKILDQATENDIVVYEMSSFQLWDLTKSPHIAVVLRIEPDHLNVHKDYQDYINAKGHIAEFQNSSDAVIYFKDNADSTYQAAKGRGQKIPYPISTKSAQLLELLDALAVPGEHNRENAEAALLAVAAFLNQPLEEFIKTYPNQIKTAFQNFKGLPHHIEFVRSLNGVDYYDDSFSASYPSLEVAIKTFANKKIILIAGGKDRGLDLTAAKKTIFSAPNLVKVILIGETKHQLAKGEDSSKYILCDTLKQAVTKAREIAEKDADVVLLSPGAASFDMFKDFYERGDLFKQYVKEL